MITRRQFLKGMAAESAALLLTGSLCAEAFADDAAGAADAPASENAGRDGITVLGTRGSLPVSGKDFLRFGGATTCFLVRMDGELILLDAGTGMARIPKDVLSAPQISLLLSHPHVDHMQGIPMCPYLSQKTANLSVYAAEHGGLNTESQILAFFSPPLWPINPTMMPGKSIFHDMKEAFRIGDVLVEFMEGVHPGGVSLFKLTGSRKTLVFATDCTLTDELRPKLQEFAEGCDVLMIDGQYSDDEWKGRETYGHTRWTEAARFGQDCHAACIKIIHHDPNHTDDDLDAAESEAKAVCRQCSFAREGEIIPLQE